MIIIMRYKIFIMILLGILILSFAYAKDLAMRFPSGTPIAVGEYVNAPLAPTSTCNQGQWSIADGWFYSCIASNTWQRASLATWVTSHKNVLWQTKQVTFGGKNVVR
jgi:hypothetical protein